MQLSQAQIAKYLDVDFATAVPPGAMLGCIPRPPEERAGHAGIPLYRDVRNVIPESQWPELIEKYTREGWPQRKLCTYVHDQNGEPSCVSNAFVAAHEIKQAEQWGRDKVTLLSPISVYEHVGSRMSGSTLTANMRRMLSVGALPLDTPENRAKFKHVRPHNGYGRGTSTDEAGETANLFKNAEWADIDSWAEFVSALLAGHPVIYARSGHCILGVGLQPNMTLDYLNSWSLNWGNPVNEELSGGLGHDSVGTARRAASGSMALLSVQAPHTEVT